MSDHDKTDDVTDQIINRALDAWTPMDPPVDFADRVLSARTPLVPQVARAKRAWWLAAPVAAAAMIALVLFTMRSSDKAATAGDSPRVAMEARNGVSEEQGLVGSGTAAGVAMNQPVIADAGVATQNTPLVDMASSDVAIAAGASATVHDLSPTTNVQIDFASRCPIGATLTATRDRIGNRAAATARANGLTHAVISVDAGSWAYQVWCAPYNDNLAAEGTIRVVRDDGRRKVPTQQLENEIDADGRTWHISYQWRPPTILVRVGKDTTKLTVGQDGGVAMDIPVEFGVARIEWDKLREGTFILFPEPVTAAWKKTRLVLDYDRTAPILSVGKIKEPASGGMKITGQIQHDWSVDVNGVPAYINKKTRTFEGDVSFSAVVLHAKHPTHEHHFFVLPVISR